MTDQRHHPWLDLADHWVVQARAAIARWQAIIANQRQAPTPVVLAIDLVFSVAMFVLIVLTLAECR